MSKKQKEQRKAIKEMMDSVEEGHAFTVYGKEGPLAMVLPWADWQALNQKLITYEVRDKVPEAMMATEADEAELRRRYGKGSEELADEAEKGYPIPEDLWGQGDVAQVPTTCPHCSSVLVTKNWPKGSENFYQWCEKCRCTVVFVTDDEEDEGLADEAEKTVYEPRNEISDRWYPR